jgi:putative hydroxymethylpyrimidine transport system substrate-binding protein
MGLNPIGFYPEQSGVPADDELILVAARDRAGEACFPGFVAALRADTQCLLDDPDRLWKALVGEHSDLDNALNKAAWMATLPALARDSGRLGAGYYLGFQDFLIRQGVIAKPKKLDGFALQVGP